MNEISPENLEQRYDMEKRLCFLVSKKRTAYGSGYWVGRVCPASVLLVFETFFTPISVSPRVSQMCLRTHLSLRVKCPLFLFDFNPNLNKTRFIKYSSIKLHENSFCGSWAFTSFDIAV